MGAGEGAIYEAHGEDVCVVWFSIVRKGGKGYVGGEMQCGG
jgi:hypothetical protein